MNNLSTPLPEQGGFNEKLDNLWVNIHFKEDSVPSLRGGSAPIEAQERIAQLQAELKEAIRGVIK